MCKANDASSSLRINSSTCRIWVYRKTIIVSHATKMIEVSITIISYKNNNNNNNNNNNTVTLAGYCSCTQHTGNESIVSNILLNCSLNDDSDGPSDGPIVEPGIIG